MHGELMELSTCMELSFYWGNQTMKNSHINELLTILEARSTKVKRKKEKPGEREQD